MKPEKIRDPDLGEYYRATCQNCGKIIEGRSAETVLNNIINHRGTHNGHS